MNWILVALIAPIMWSIATIFDKILVTKFQPDGLAAGILTNVSAGILSLILSLFFPITTFSNNLALTFVFCGIIWGFTRIFWVLAMAKEEASRVSTITQVTPVLILIGSIIFFKETFSGMDLLAFAMILAGALWISVKKVKGSVHISDALIFIIGNIVFFTATTLILKTISGKDTWTSLFWINMGFAASAFFLLPFKGKEAIMTIKRHHFKVSAILFLIAFLTLGGRTSYFLALEMAPAALVAVITTTSSFFVLIMTTILSAYAPNILKEEVSAGALISKIGAIVLIILGIAIIYLF